MKKLKFLIPLLLITLTACGDDKPAGVMAEHKYIEVFAELLVVDQISDNQLGSVNRQFLLDEIYEKYNVTEEQFRISHNYYQQQPEAQVRRIDKIEKIISTERDTIQASLRRHQDEEMRRNREISDSLDALDMEPDTLNQESDN